MQASTLWWIAAGLAVGAELLSGTFYLLLFSLGLAAAALAAMAGLSPALQWLAAALVGGGACALWYLKRGRAPAALPTERNPDVNIDIGQRIVVRAWNEALPGARHTARVHYRGSQWAAVYSGQGTPAPGDYVIRAVHGNELHLDHA
jgi:membrane protein implicated in regulation of membrane protease activity